MMLLITAFVIYMTEEIKINNHFFLNNYNISEMF